MTAPKLPRNTKELPVSTAIEKLMALAIEKDAAIEDVHADYANKARAILFRVPEVVREHVAEQSGADFFSAVPTPDPTPPASAEEVVGPSRSDDAQDDVAEGMGIGPKDPTAWLNKEPPPLQAVEVSEGKGRRVGVGRQ